MKTMKRLLAAAIAACLGAIAVPAQASDLLFSQLVDGQSVFGPSDVWTPSNVDREVADDFDVVGSIDRVVADGSASDFLTFQGVHVRFYAYNTDGTPGALQQEYFFTTGYNAGTVDVTLSPAFAATGKHFLSVQPVIDGWYWWSANTNAPHGPNFYYRDNAAGDVIWQHDNTVFYPNSDVAFALYGTVSGAGQITSLSATTLERSGYLEINGSNFGSDGTVLIDGVSAPVADWQSTKIVCYVPESTRLATVPVQMVNGSGLPSNTSKSDGDGTPGRRAGKLALPPERALFSGAPGDRPGWNDLFGRCLCPSLCADTGWRPEVAGARRRGQRRGGGRGWDDLRGVGEFH